MSYERYDKVIIFTPDGVTGGPECLHQLGYVINKLGGRAYMVYTNPFSSCELREDIIISHFNPNSPGFNEYQRYGPRISPEIEITSNTMLIFPEFYYVEPVAQALKWNLPFMCWWLAAPAPHENFDVLGKELESYLFTRPIHLYQSHHSERYLNARGTQTYPLFDYTNFVPLNITRIPRSIALSTKKGGDIAQEFMNLFSPSEVEFFLIKNLTHAEVFRLLSSVEIYVDFSPQLGRDRIPREAALAGATVFVRREGAGAEFGDTPLPPFFKFNPTTSELKTLVSRIREVLDKTANTSAQVLYREQTRLEYDAFELQVRRLFFT